MPLVFITEEGTVCHQIIHETEQLYFRVIWSCIKLIYKCQTARYYFKSLFCLLANSL